MTAAVQLNRVRRIAKRVVSERLVAVGREVERVELDSVLCIGDHESVRSGVELKRERRTVVGIVVESVPMPNVPRSDAPRVPSAIVNLEPKAIVKCVGRMNTPPNEVSTGSRYVDRVLGVRGAWLIHRKHSERWFDVSSSGGNGIAPYREPA